MISIQRGGGAVQHGDAAVTDPLRRACRGAFDGWTRFASGRDALALMFAWALAEATVWPVIPDALLAPLVVGNRRRFHVTLVAATAGMALGGGISYGVAFRDPRFAGALLRRLPLAPVAHLDIARRHLARHGVSAFLYQPWSGVALKIWAVAGAELGLPPSRVIPAFVVGRSLRLAVTALVARLVARYLAGALRDFFLPVLAAYLAAFLYGWLRLLRRS
jgi:membrane protein YqaA with SNARE-associated domain